MNNADLLNNAVFRVVLRRKIYLTNEELLRIDACRDIAVLDKWLARAATAEVAGDIFRDDEPTKESCQACRKT